MPAGGIKHRSRLYEIDFLRFLAAIMVLLYHYTYTFDQVIHILPSPFPFRSVSRYGYLGVELFFIISGYVVLMSASNKTVDKFIISRIVRIYPAAALVTTLIFVGSFFVGTFEGFSAPTLSMYFYNLVLVHDFLGKAAVNPVYWSLSYELSFYFLICLCIGFKVLNNLLLVITIWLAISTILGPMATNSAFAYLAIPKYSSFFIAGMLFYMIQNKMATSWKLYLLLFASFITALRSANAGRIQMQQFMHDYFGALPVLLAVSSFFLVFLLIVLNKFNLSKFPQLEKLGNLTYPLYLIHGLGAGAFWFLGGKVNKYVLLAGVTCIMLSLSWLIYTQIERRFGKVLTRQLSNLSEWVFYKKTNTSAIE